MWHWTLVSCTPSKSTGLLFCFALFWCWVSLCAPFTSPLIACYFIMMVANILGIFMSIAIHYDPHRRSETCNFGSPTKIFAGCFCPGQDWIEHGTARGSPKPPYPLCGVDNCGNYVFRYLDWFSCRLRDMDGSQSNLTETVSASISRDVY